MIDTEEIRIAEAFRQKKKELIYKIENRAASTKIRKTDFSPGIVNCSPKMKRKTKNKLRYEHHFQKISKSQEEEKKINECNKEVIERLKKGERINVILN